MLARHPHRGTPLRITGSITALATPFGVDGELDLDAWRRLIAGQISGGTEAIVVAGSTGEAAGLYDAEIDVLVRSAVEQVAGRILVLVGTGQSNTAKTIEATRRAAALGADAALVVTPPYVRPTQDGLVAHYRAIADDDALPIVLYNVPGRTGVDMQPDTVAQLASHRRIVGIKEAVADAQRMTALLALRDDGFTVLSGDDETAARAMLAGADGLVSVASNVAPATFRALCDLARSGERVGCDALVVQLGALNAFLGVEPNPIPVKAILARLGIGHGLRLPLLPLSAAHRDEANAMTDLVASLEHTRRAERVA